MEQLSLKNRILRFYRNHNGEWINGGEIERLALNVGKKASNASRRLRELHEEGLLEREERRGKGVKTVWYRYKPRVIEEFIRTNEMSFK